ncbi:hypothetical protein SELR_14240 [Selenomonas ruminantium subsp. lactilytica TAM6421]|uniref:Fructosamine kinase n=1 Tax=Selenomonas ruminantium subsp. lactilytica (strain NBRC 103574 / TAM6421) TaxID=927704 RepID=I0GQU5_SELRL|nr:fructosamine kinase family protein [Selenomonas ruminantium]BAL83132.1 hypothetical protein SELR_14240 [Selenomonas ruminantium subsp. lactilytica TAM6421]
MELVDVIRQIYGEEVYITDRIGISGGDINDAYHLCLSNGENLFIKMNANAKDDFFAAEKTGLEALHKAGAVTLSVITYDKTKDNLSYLLLNFVRSSRPKRTYWEDLGHMLAQVHHAAVDKFGGFSPEFYDAYHEIIPKEPGYTVRRDLYNLYHLLNHLNLFGRSYLAAGRRILKSYSQK